ncbi:hypothetical protein HT576_11750 [Haloterrigena sp. SYSU A121-1]|uniref:Uncharacterized protein n=1 Tax=Haloterrigena gelatinilytica TaxID=2741724 RepID=A0A8J8GKH7_9EURY|nr:hypothetical protein [Haloterrigena gelatinilytica]NUB91688.1 hypothetical protein [Haloterrigena gelatinilytica]
MSGGLNEDNREEWQIVEPDDENGVLGWRVILVEETDGLFLEAHDKDDRRLDSLVLEPYLLGAYVLTFKQAAYHTEKGEDLPWDEQNDREWERVLNPFDEHIGVEYYMEFVEAGVYELGTRDAGKVESRVEIGAPWLEDFIEVFEDVEGYYRDWVLADSEP